MKSFDCPHCGKRYSRIKKEMMGKKARCECGQVFRIGQVASIQNEYQYDDLEAILSGEPVAPERGLSPPTVPQRQNRVGVAPVSPVVPVSPGVSSVQPSKARRVVGVLSVVVATVLAFWLGLFVVATRFGQLDLFLLRPFSTALTGIYEGSLGEVEMAPGLKRGFWLVGWGLWSVALMMLLMAIVQFFNALSRMFIQREVLRWADGGMAALGVVFLFLIVAALFLNLSHTANVRRELSRLEPSVAVTATDLPNLQRLLDENAQKSEVFVRTMLVMGGVPLTIFVLSMVRLFVKSK